MLIDQKMRFMMLNKQSQTDLVDSVKQLKEI